MKATFVLAAMCMFIVVCPFTLQAEDPQSVTTNGLTNGDIVNLVKHQVPPEQIVPMIHHSPVRFDMSLHAIDSLKSAGVPPVVIDAMLSTRGDQQSQGANPPAPEPAKPTDIPPPPDIHPAPATPAVPAAGNGQPGAKGTAGGSAGSAAPPSASRLQQAKSAAIPPDTWTPPAKEKDPGCPITNHGKLINVDLDYDSGSASASRLTRAGTYCFALRKANPLYDWLVTLNVTEPTGNPFDLLNDAIQTLTKLSTGASSAKPTPMPGQAAVSCPDLAAVKKTSASLTQALSALVPGKDNSGTVAYVPLQKTLADWQAVPGAFTDFEQAVKALAATLPDAADASCDAVLLQAESTILDDYPKLRKQYQDLSKRLSGPDVVYYERPLENTVPADLVSTPSYSGTSAASKTFHFDASFGILSSSAGFLLTQLPARSYSSATAPDPNDPTKTQNVLKLDYGAGTRPALTVLLTGNVPHFNTRNYGLGVSAGPVFDISNGKADTSRFGFFGGLSLRLTPWIYLTPGVHVGEFADFPPGFTHAGQVVPPNTGTPTATKRYSARFAFAITFKLKDLGASTGSDQTKTQQQGAPSAQQPAKNKP
jgi:hypothetical protein